MTLHTRYRPKTFDEVIGQDAAVAAIESVLKKRSNQTFLFHGPSGTGKTTLARICATELGCKAGGSIIEFDAATHTGIDDMREIVSNNTLRPLGGGNRAIIIDEVHAISKSAWASMLKVLEEPQAWLFWFLCTTELGKVPANIKTRCASFEMKAVSEDDLFGLLKTIISKERIGPPDDILDLCVREAYGSPRQAIVNLGICASVQNKQEAAELLRSAEAAGKGVIDLCQALLKREAWNRVRNILNDLKDTNAESVKAVVCDYMTKVVLNAKEPKSAGMATEVLSAFINTPFYQGSGFAPVVVACAKVIL